MLYRNKKTGAVIETACLISGGDWEPDKVDSAPNASSEETDTEADPTAVKPKRKGRAAV